MSAQARSPKPSTKEVGEDIDRWRMALESAGDGMWDWHLPSNSVIYSDRWKTMLGYMPDEIGDDFQEWQSRVHPDDLPGVLEQIHAHLVRQSPGYSVEFRMQCKDGGWKWILARGMVIGRDDEGRPLHIIGTHTDITVWRSAQQRESAILRMIIQEKPLGEVLEAIVLGVEASHSGIICCLHQYDEATQCLRVACGPGLPASYRKAVECMPVGEGMSCCSHVVLKGERVVCRSITKDPAWSPLRAAASRAGLVSCWAEPVRDGGGRVLGLLASYHRVEHVPAAAELASVEAATHLAALAFGHHSAQQRLRESEERYARAMEGTTDGLWDWNVLTDEVYLAPRWKQMLGYEPHELPQSRQASFLDHLHPDDVENVNAARKAHFKDRVPYQVEFRLRTKSGGYRWFLARGKAQRDARGRPVHMTGTISDIDDRKRAEEALRETERFNKTVLDQTSAIILVLDAQGRFTHANKAFVELLGYSERMIIGRSPWDSGLLSPEDVPRSQKRFENLLKGKGNPPVELRVRSKSGQFFHVEICSTPLCRPDGSVERIIITGTDITVRRQLEQEVIRVAEEEQATIGHNLHDGIGQTLTGIHSLTVQLADELKGEHQKSASRISQLLQDAVAEVRRMSHGLSPVSVRHRGLAGGLKLLAETISTDFRVKTTCEVDADVQLGDAEREANLYRIAQEAVNNALRHGKPRHISITLKRLTASHAGLEVRDDGRGMKLNQSKGNGIGLRVMRYRSDLIGGELSIRAAPRRGVRVTCCFPCPLQTRQPETKPPRSRSKSKTAGERRRP
jgi:PAS domain S-box-containing protein